jgi:hypothetical protein
VVLLQSYAWRPNDVAGNYWSTSEDGLGAPVLANRKP